MRHCTVEEDDFATYTPSRYHWAAQYVPAVGSAENIGSFESATFMRNVPGPVFHFFIRVSTAGDHHTARIILALNRRNMDHAYRDCLSNGWSRAPHRDAYSFNNQKTIPYKVA
jgi:hypothetical protein